MPVIDEGGVVGQIVRVTPFTSEAALLTDDKVSIPVLVLRNGLRLIAFGGNISGKLEVRYLTSDVDLEPGDVLVTSGIGGIFPAGLSVGKVDHVERDDVTGFALAVATPLSHPERFRHFLVLRVDVSGPDVEKEAWANETQSAR
jgi:rod shape-determining protein MreC